MRFYFTEAEIWEKQKEDTFEKINRSGLPLVLFGAAPAAGPAFLRQVSIPVSVICDNNPAKWGTQLWGLEVVNPARLSELYPAYNALILVPFEHQIVPQLAGLPTPPEQIFRLDLYFEEKNTSEFFQTAQAELEEIYARLADQESKDTFEAVIHYRINRDPQILKRVSLPRAEQYFPTELGGRPLLNENEIFVDSGAFTGDTVKGFCAAVSGKYEAIYAFEPESKNYETLLQTAQGVPNIFCQQTAVSDRKGTLQFVADDSGSKADVSGNETVQTDTLDHMLGGAAVTYLKMDVEGMECAALRGAAGLIQAHRPKLAVCTYHSNADMIQIPKLIREMDSSYQLYFRHYTNALVETVCYAL